MSVELIERNFPDHSLISDGKKTLIDVMTTVAKKLAYQIRHSCLECRERSLAMTKLEECVFWARAAIERESQDSQKEKDNRLDPLVCPECGGPTEHDREYPPNPYICSECSEKEDGIIE